ncbi:MAG: NAD(P)-binding protein [Chloroflexota bacterium]|nr:MAG: hypothetical protein DLM70_08215 [Chloroflexota bacterium]
MARRDAVATVGGGIAGLTPVHRLSRLIHPDGILLVEQSSRLGAKILTDHVQDFVVEGGTDSFLASKPQALELCRSPGIDGDLLGTLLVPARLEPLMDSPLFTREGKERVAAEIREVSASRSQGIHAPPRFVGRAGQQHSLQGTDDDLTKVVTDRMGKMRGVHLEQEMTEARP